MADAHDQHGANHGDEPDLRRIAGALPPPPPKAGQRHGIEPERRDGKRDQHAERGEAGQVDPGVIELDRPVRRLHGDAGEDEQARQRRRRQHQGRPPPQPPGEGADGDGAGQKPAEQGADIVDADRGGGGQHGDRRQVEVAAPVEIGFRRGDMAGDQRERADRRHLPEVGSVEGEGFHRLRQRQGEQQQGSGETGLPGRPPRQAEGRQDHQAGGEQVRDQASGGDRGDAERGEQGRPGIEDGRMGIAHPAVADQRRQALAGCPTVRGSRIHRARVRAARHRCRRSPECTHARGGDEVGVSSSRRSGSAVVVMKERAPAG